MEQKISEQYTEICRLKQLVENGSGPSRREGNSSWTRDWREPKITRVPRTPPRQLKSIVYKMPKRLTYSKPWIQKKTRRQEWTDLFVPEKGWVELNWLFNVTINDISVIYVTAHRCAGLLKKELDLRSDFQRHRQGSLTCPSKTPTRDQPFHGYSEKPPQSVAFYDAHGDTEYLV